jgi:hypothetical protein
MNTPYLNMTEQEIEAELTAICLLTDERHKDLCDNAPALAGLVSHFELLEPQERDRMHILKMALTIQYWYLHTPQAAHGRIMERIKARHTSIRSISI